MIKQIGTNLRELKKRGKINRVNGYKGKKFPWIHDPQGVVAKILLGMLRDAEYEENEDSFPSAERCLQVVLDRVPGLAERYGDYCGKELTSSICYNRMHKQFYKTRGKGRSRYSGRGEEHYKSDPKLTKIAALVQSKYNSRSPFTLKVCKDLCDKAGVDYKVYGIGED